MNWFYAKDGQQAGPVDDAELARLVSAGDINDATLVWHGGLANWQPYATVRGEAEAGRTATLPTADPGAPLAAGQAQCSQCGRILPADEVVRLDGLEVCAECKPGFLQRQREGAPLQNAGLAPLQYAGFWVRFGAAMLDGIILIPFYIALVACFYFFTDLHNIDFAHIDPQQIARATRGFLPISLVASFVLACYSALCLNRFGGTPGKRICDLRVLHGDTRERVTFLRGLGRYAVKMVPRAIPGLLVSFLPIALPNTLPTLLVYAWALTDSLFIVFDARKRALHDMICDTRVVYDVK